MIILNAENSRECIAIEEPPGALLLMMMLLIMMMISADTLNLLGCS